MKKSGIVMDSNVLVAGLLSRNGASYRLLQLMGKGKFELHLSVPLLLEYEDAAKRLVSKTDLTQKDIDDILDYLCLIGKKWEIHYLWRPFLKDPNDDMVLELAVTARCEWIVTFNTRDFAGIEQFGIRVLTPRDFLKITGEIP
jgi:putative PIN family toxin of toxin-antitoxin system